MGIFPESTWTTPRVQCPNPERWHSTDSDSTEIEVTALVAAMVTALRPVYVIETGTSIGLTAFAIGEALLLQGYGQLDTLETDPDLARGAAVRCGGLRVNVVRGSSLDFTPRHPIDFAWFDSLVQIRHKEYLRFLPWMHDRTVVGFHDTGVQHPVRNLLQQHLINPGLITEPLFLPTPRGVCFARPTIKALATPAATFG